MSIARITVPAAVVVAALVALAARDRSVPPVFGFTRDGAIAEATLERHFLSLTSVHAIRSEHRILAGAPHPAGSRRDYELAIRTRDRFAEFGLEDVEIATHEVMLPVAEEVSVEMVRPVRWRASLREEPLERDAYTSISPEEVGIPYHAYSASGEVTAAAVDAGAGQPSDYAALSRRGIDVRGRIVLARSAGPYSYRGFKVFAAQQRGAAGILIYADPAEESSGRGLAYPDGPWGPPGRIQRGGVAYDFLVPGDPLTPGWASTGDAPRVEKTEAISLPRIPSAPISYPDARTILDAREPVVRMHVRHDDRVRPIWTVTGLIRGREHPDEMVIVGNHRDAWVYGAVDPSGGSAALMELARTLGALTKNGWRPARSILFASWDAEEFALTSSTEWGEQHADLLTRHAVAYINVDSGASGSAFSVRAVPALNRTIAEAAGAVRDPVTRISLAATARDRQARERGALQDASAALVDNQLGGGSDYTVFLNHLGIPVADLAFRGPYGVYHSLYDTPAWVAQIGDPGYRYHAALVQVWGILTLRLANADALPLDYRESAGHVARLIRQLARQRGSAPVEWAELHEAAAQLETAAAAFGRERDAALAGNDRPALLRLNRKLIAVERALLDRRGLSGRPWYRHLLYAPRFTYEPEVLPGLTEALEANDPARAADEAARLAAALVRAARALE